MQALRGGLVLASLVLVTSCSAPGGSSAPATVTVTSSTDTSSPAPTTAPTPATVTTTMTPTSTSTTTRGTTQPGGSLPTETGSYADGFVRAWGIGDREDASRYATPLTVSTLFSQDARGGSSWKRQQSTDQGERTQVRYTDGTGMTLYVLVDRGAASAGSQDAVVGASLEYEGSDSYDPGEDSAGLSDITVSETTVGSYGDALVRAWGAGRRTTADRYATDTAMFEMFDVHGAGGAGWSRTSSDSYSATYTNTDGSTLTLYINDVAVAAGRGDGVYYAEFS